MRPRGSHSLSRSSTDDCDIFGNRNASPAGSDADLAAYLAQRQLR
jgi:hypothetical protein